MKVLHIFLLSVCLKLSTNSELNTQCKFRLALLHFPPYITNSSLHQGFMYHTIKWFVDMACFGRQAGDPITCYMKVIFLRSQDEIVNLIKTKQVDLAFPLQTKSKININGQPNVTMIRTFVSNGISLIATLKQCEEESQKQLSVSFTSQWPILVCMMLLSGISGVLVWLLVRTWIILVILYHISMSLCGTG